MKPFPKLLFAVFFLPFFSHAQDTYQPGVVVNLKGDTIHGFINFREWEVNPKSILFQAGTGVSPVKYSVSDIKYFNVNAGYLAEYQRYTGLISMNYIEVNQISNSRDTTMHLDTVFLKVMQRGKNVQLYSYSDKIKTRYFITEKPADQPKELMYRLYYNSNEENGYDRTTHENTWQRQLYQVALKTNTLTDHLKVYIEKSQYKELDIVDITSQINGISAAESSKSLTKHSKLTKVIAIVGLIAVIIGCIHEFSTIHEH